MNYKVYQGTELKQTVTSKTAVMNGLQPNRNYEFGVEADNGANLLTGTSSDLQTAPDSQSSVAGGVLHQFSSNDLSILAVNQVRVSVFIHNTTTHTVNLVIWTNAGDFGVGTGVPAGTDGYSTITAYSSTPSVSRGDISIRAYTENAAISGVQYKELKLEKVSVATTSVTTRGIRFNIPKTLTAGSTVTLHYEEYPLGIVPIGNEPSGYFGGGNRQNLSAKVISTANGSSVVEVAGNVIEVGGRNLLVGTSEDELSGKSYLFTEYQISGGLQPGTTYTLSGCGRVDQTSLNQSQNVFVYLYSQDWSWASKLNIDRSLTSKYGKVTFTTPSGKSFHSSATVYLSHPNGDGSKDSISGTGYISKFKLEPGTIATPYASFVDGDTLTAQPDGTCALFSEYKALYY